MDANSDRYARLNELLKVAMDGDLSDEQCAEIEQLMADDDLRTYAAEMMQFHGLLQWHGSDLAAFVDAAETVTLRTRPQQKASTPNAGWRLGLFAALAASLLFVAALSHRLRGPDEPKPVVAAREEPPQEKLVLPMRPARFIGVVKQMSGDAASKRALPAIGGFISDEPIELVSGSMTINLFEGADLKMVGPCRVEFDSSPDEISCLSGRVQLDIYDPESRLRLKTPTGEVLHIGTSYGVAVEEESGRTAIEVFDGQVEFVSSSESVAPASSRVFTPGALVQLATNGSLSVDDEAMDWDTIDEESRYRDPPLPRFTQEGVSCIVAYAPGRRAIDEWHIEDGQLRMPTIEAAEAMFAQRLRIGDVVEVFDIDAIDFQDGFGESKDQDTLRSYVNLYQLDRPAPGVPDTLRGSDCFVTKYTGRIIVEQSWRYSFVVNADDGYRLKIDGQSVMVDQNTHPPQTSIVTLPLERGVHEFELLAFEHYGFHRVEVGVAVGRARQLEKFQLLRRPEILPAAAPQDAADALRRRPRKG